MQPSVLRLSTDDNVVVALRDLEEGETLLKERLVCKGHVPSGHKVATKTISQGERIHKYGQGIGVATREISPGEHVHTHNMEMADLERAHDIGADARPTSFVPEEQRATFSGIVRTDGRVGTRNYIGILSSVSCSGSVCRMIAERFRGEGITHFPNVDGVVALPHSLGCGMSGTGEGFEILQRSLDGYARNPNFAGIIMVGLGCEVNQIHRLFQDTGLRPSENLRTLCIQDNGGTEGTVLKASDFIETLLPLADRVERKEISASHLVVGLECGGSDAYSGITANPALGAAVDLLVAHGGTAILSETPEIYGAEHLLVRRASIPEVGHALIERIRWWEAYAALHDGRIDNNPTPGNKAGGLTTILEKSLGAVSKGGTTNLNGVYRYADPVNQKGLVFMDTPGYDIPSITGMVAGGATVVCFSTGRGSVTGGKPTPVIKLATNTPMYRRMSGDMDIDCGPIAEGEATIEEIGKVIFRKILDTASGEKTKSERLGFGDCEFTPWQIGAVF